jgi:hypothetical protein
MKLSHRCPKCQGSRVLLTHVRVESWVGTAAGTLGAVDRWYEEWVCARCRYAERHHLAAMPPRLEVERAFDSPGGEAPYR